jgi:hypothetical protein
LRRERAQALLIGGEATLRCADLLVERVAQPDQ